MSDEYEYYRGSYNELVYRVDLYDNVEVYKGHEIGWTPSFGSTIGGDYNITYRLRNSPLWNALDGEPLDVIG